MVLSSSQNTRPTLAKLSDFPNLVFLRGLLDRPARHFAAPWLAPILWESPCEPRYFPRNPRSQAPAWERTSVKLRFTARTCEAEHPGRVRSPAGAWERG